jgi:molybdopterin-synthase adenylyltransferase
VVQYRVLPFEWREEDGAINLARGGFSTRFTDPAVAAFLELLLGRQSGPVDPEALKAELAAPEHDLFERVVEFLAQRRILVAWDLDDAAAQYPAETPRDVFFWEFMESAQTVAARLESIGIAVVGVNETARQLCQSLAASGAGPRLIIDDPLLRNLSLFDGDTVVQERWNNSGSIVAADRWEQALVEHNIGCVVATGDHGGTHHFNRWNARCLEKELHFFPVLLRQYQGLVGPFVIPGETACYACYRARDNSAKPSPSRLPYEQSPTHAWQSAVGYLPPMATMLGALASVELIKFYAQLLPSAASRVIEFNFIGSKATPRPILKVPRCPACSTLNEHARVQILKEPGIASTINDFHREEES